jgi:hypothetical protein
MKKFTSFNYVSHTKVSFYEDDEKTRHLPTLKRWTRRFVEYIFFWSVIHFMFFENYSLQRKKKILKEGRNSNGKAMCNVLPLIFFSPYFLCLKYLIAWKHSILDEISSIIISHLVIIISPSCCCQRCHFFSFSHTKYFTWLCLVMHSTERDYDEWS